MRADRLVAILLMLQRRPQVTAAEVADELEVSERTARRDLDALAMAGVPVYSQPGRGGGWRLAGGGRIDLSGLSADEARALFLVAGPTADATPEVRGALRKLVRALPEPLRGSAEAAADAVVVDRAGWGRAAGEVRRPPLLDEVQAAVVDGRCLRMGYASRAGESTERVIHPLGLATKGRSWYLVADTDAGLRTFRVDRVTSAEPTGDPVVRPEGFELSTAWQTIVGEIDRMRTPLTVRARATEEALVYLRAMFGDRVAVGTAESSDPTARRPVEIRMHSVRSAATELAGYGSILEVTEPPELRELLADIGSQLVASYSARGTETP